MLEKKKVELTFQHFTEINSFLEVFFSPLYLPLRSKLSRKS